MIYINLPCHVQTTRSSSSSSISFYHQQQQCDFFKTTAITKSGLSEHLCEWLKFKVIDGRITFLFYRF